MTISQSTCFGKMLYCFGTSLISIKNAILSLLIYYRRWRVLKASCDRGKWRTRRGGAWKSSLVVGRMLMQPNDLRHTAKPCFTMFSYWIWFIHHTSGTGIFGVTRISDAPGHVTSAVAMTLKIQRLPHYFFLALFSLDEFNFIIL